MPGMNNPDLTKQVRLAIQQRMAEAVQQNNTDGFMQAWADMQEQIQTEVMTEARTIMAQNDTAVLAQRGVRQLTTEERAYFDGLIQAMRAPNPQQAIADYTPVMPKTTIDAVFEDLRHNHPLLDAVNFQNTSGLIEYIVNTNSKELASWGTLTAAITKELSSGFQKLSMTLCKLSAWMPVPKSMLDLGPAWMDRYVREILGEALAFGLEEGIINGTGNDMPIGMNRNVSSTANVVGGVYPVKDTVSLTSFKPSVYGPFLANLAEDENGNARNVDEVLFICNPADYLNKVMPAITFLTPNGTYIGNVFPVPTRVIQSAQVPNNRAIVGLAKRYFMGVGTGKEGKIEYDDSVKFLDDVRAYLVKLYGYGKPLDNNAFIYADITHLQPLALPVEPVGPNANLSALSVGDLSLVPAFDEIVSEYTIETEEDEITVTATPVDANASVRITLGNAIVTSGSSASLAYGDNIISIRVKNGMMEKTYTITVKRPDAHLATLAIGSLILTPSFDKDTETYTATTSNATNTITATAADTDATVTIKNGSTVVASGSAATWETGANTVTVKVKNGIAEKTYTVTVTKT